MVADAGAIPTIDCKGDVLESWREIFDAVTTVGFVYLTNCGVNFEHVEDTFEKGRRFWKLEREIKRKYEYSGKLDGYTGYTGIGIETFDPTHHGVEARESYNFARRDGPNLKIPEDEVPGMSKSVERTLHHCEVLGMNVLKVFAKGLNLEESFFTRHHDKIGVFGKGTNSSIMRLLHYPPVPHAPEYEVPRLGNHTDYGTLTLLFQDNTGGLEIMNPKGEYVPATPVKDAVLINTGDLLEYWTSGAIKAVRHRIVTPETGNPLRYKDRYSIVYFVHPNEDCLVHPLNGTSKAIAAVEHLEERLFDTYTGP